MNIRNGLFWPVLTKNQIFMTKEKQFMDALQVLENAGYYVRTLWSIQDVYARYQCDENTAFDILDAALNSEGTFSQTWNAIEYEITKTQKTCI